MRILFVASRDKRERYRFLLEPLQETDAETSVYRESSGLLLSIFGLLVVLTKNRTLDVVVLIGSDFRNYLWFLFIRLLTSARVVTRFGGDPVSVRQSMQSELLRKSRYKEYIKSRLGTYFSKFLLWHSDGVIVVSEHLKRAVAPYVVDCEKVLVSAPAPQLKGLDECAGSRDEAFHVLTVTNLNYREKADGVIDILKRLLVVVSGGIGEQRIIYDVVGGGHQLEYLRQEVARLVPEQLDSLEVRIYGKTDNAKPFYCDADLFAYSSTLDAYPLVLVEAQAYGLPILINSWGPFPEILEDGKGVCFMREGREDVASNYISRLMKDDAFLMSMRQDALSSYREKSSLSHLASGLTGFFGRLQS